MIKRISIASIVTSLLTSMAVGSYAETIELGKLGCIAPKLTGLEWVKGDAIEMEKDSVYVVEFWATWCGPCVAGMPHLTELQHKYKDQGVSVIGISKETLETVVPFVEKKGKVMGYTVAVDREGDVYNSYMKAFNQGGIPHAFIIDKAGHIAWHGHPATMDGPLVKILAGTFNVDEFAKQMEEEKKAKEERLRKLTAERLERSKKIAVVNDQIQSDPDNPELYVKRAQMHLGESFITQLGYNPGALVDAVADYKKALELNPESESILENIAFFEAFQTRDDTRVDKLKAFVSKYPQSIRSPFASFSLAYYADKAGNIEEALEYVAEAEKAEVGGDFAIALGGVRERLESQLEIEKRPSD